MIRTPNLGLATWLENDIVNFEDINDNFEKLDNCIVGLSKGYESEPATVIGGGANASPWKYKTYSDGSTEITIAIQYAALRCCTANSAAGVYASETSTVYLPPTHVFDYIHDIRITAVNELSVGTKQAYNWASIIEYDSFSRAIRFALLSTESEPDTNIKQVYISIKGGPNP